MEVKTAMRILDYSCFTLVTFGAATLSFTVPYIIESNAETNRAFNMMLEHQQLTDYKQTHDIGLLQDQVKDLQQQMQEFQQP